LRALSPIGRIIWAFGFLSSWSESLSLLDDEPEDPLLFFLAFVTRAAAGVGAGVVFPAVVLTGWGLGFAETGSFFAIFGEEAVGG